MRTAKIEINGEKHLLCFNLWALIECTERYGSFSGIGPALSEGTVGKTVGESLWLLETLMKAGVMYAEEMGIPNADPVSADKMLRTCGADFFVNLKANIMDAINTGMGTNIKVENSKNAETTQV